MAALALTAACCLGQAIDYSLRDAERLRKHLILDTYIDSGAPKREPPSPPIEGTLTPLGAPHTLARPPQLCLRTRTSRARGCRSSSSCASSRSSRST